MISYALSYRALPMQVSEIRREHGSCRRVERKPHHGLPGDRWLIESG
jgi:hypothetical protein